MNNKDKRPRRKPGRTLLISNEYSENLDYEGILSTHSTNSGSRFIVFDTVDNSRNAYNDLRTKGTRVKYSYYKIFFRLRDIELDSIDYNDLKEEVKGLLSEIDNVSILYFKFYTKNKVLMGSGDLTVDSKEGLDALVGKRELDLKQGGISFYRFKVKNDEEEYDNDDVEQHQQVAPVEPVAPAAL